MMGRGRGQTGAGSTSIPMAQIGPFLVVGVLVLVACVIQRFSVVQIHQENLELRCRLDELKGEVNRSKEDVAYLVSRDRIERVAEASLGLRPPLPGNQVYFPEWQRSSVPDGMGSSLAASVLGPAGRGLGQVVELLKGRAGETPRLEGGN
jgi:hypothetical protein